MVEGKVVEKEIGGKKKGEKGEKGEMGPKTSATVGFHGVGEALEANVRVGRQAGLCTSDGMCWDPIHSGGCPGGMVFCPGGGSKFGAFIFLKKEN